MEGYGRQATGYGQRKRRKGCAAAGIRILTVARSP